MNKTKDELILDAIVKFKGVWPEEMSSIYFIENVANPKASYICAIGDMGEVSTDAVFHFICTKSEFEQSFNEIIEGAPKGVDHLAIREGVIEYFKKIGRFGNVIVAIDENGDNVVYNVDFYSFLELPKQKTQPWMPEVGKECEVNIHGYWFKVVVLAYGKNNYLYEIVEGQTCPEGDPLGGENMGALRESVFRPIKTEAEKQADAMFDIVKDATDLYQACELLRDAGYSK